MSGGLTQHVQQPGRQPGRYYKKNCFSQHIKLTPVVQTKNSKIQKFKCQKNVMFVYLATAIWRMGIYLKIKMQNIYTEKTIFNQF